MSTRVMNPSVGPDGHTLRRQTPGSKQIKAVFNHREAAPDIHSAPPVRVYTRDYAKIPVPAPDPNGFDSVGPFIGNPLIW